MGDSSSRKDRRTLLASGTASPRPGERRQRGTALWLEWGHVWQGHGEEDATAFFAASHLTSRGRAEA